MICSAEVERYCISSLFKYPDLISDIQAFIHEDDFASGRLNRTVYGALLDAQSKGQDVNAFSVATKIVNAGITFEELDGDVISYLEELKQINLTEKAAIEFFKDLKKISVRREIFEVGAQLQKEMMSAKNESIDDILTLADKVYGTKISSFENVLNKDFSNIYENVEDIIEERGNHPVTEFGMMGPFKRINEIYGSLLRPGNITLIGARQNVGKSSLGHFYLNKVAEQYGVPILHIDAGEMSEFELQMRSVCMMTEGKVPMNFLETGEWRKNQEFERMVRAVWPRVKKLKCFYKNIGGLGPLEIVSAIRRFYYSKVGRGNQFVTHYDYLKSFEKFGMDSPEWQQMGYFIQMLKTLITTEIEVAIWTSLQLNKSGITGNKSVQFIDDTEATFSISDRIIQQSSHAFIFRPLTLEELTLYPNMGNSVLVNRKKRHLGKDYQSALQPVRMSDGSLQDNKIFMKSESFHFQEIGDLATLKDKIGIINIHAQDSALPEDANGDVTVRKTKPNEDVEIE